MDKNSFNDELFDFIETSTCSFTCIDTIKKTLINNGYTELYENEKWNFNNGKFFVIRNDASIIAFNIGSKYKDSFNIICTHGDTPGFILKPNNEIYEYNYLKLNVMPYGGILNYGFMDRPLSISGRIIYKEDNIYKRKIVNFKEPLCVIPSEAIHINSSANSNLDLNTQTDLIPIISLSKENDIIKKVLSKHFDNKFIDSICDYDLFLYNTDKPKYVGINKDMILSPRIDNLTSTFALLKSFTESDNNNNINVMCVFNSEEIGSLTKEGADSSFLMDILKRICSLVNIDISISLHNSLIISSDNNHAVHPNHPNKSDINNKGLLNNGILIIREKDSSTDSVSSSIFKDICKKANVLYQDYTSRNDMSNGSTLSGLSIRHVSIDSIDVGIPQLAMHSSNELIGDMDTLYLYKAFKVFFDVSIKREHDNIKLIEKTQTIDINSIV